MRRRKIAIGAVVLAVGLTGGFFAFGRASGKNGTHGDSEATRSDNRTVVKTVRPRLDANFRISNQQIAEVEPFYKAGLRARAAGLVRTVRKDIGEPVRMGELLVEIDAPDLEQELEQKEAMIRQRQRELQVSRAMLKFAEAAVTTAKAQVSQRTVEAKQTAAIRDYKEDYLNRLIGLLADKSVTEEVVKENRRDYLASAAAAEAGQIAIQKAKADQQEKEASQEAAKADIQLKESLVTVAEKDRDKAAAAASFARITAPFDGVIVRRNVDPGMFVQNATNGSSEPLVTLARVDLLTVVMKLPDVAAPFISRNTDVEVTFDDLPGLTIRGKVTRYSPMIEGADRKMRVELDIFNGTRRDFQAFLAYTYAEAIAPLADTTGLGTAAAVLAAERHRQLFHKGVSEGTAVCLDGPAGPGLRPLVPGMNASMRVFLDKVSTAYLLPSSAVYIQGGKSYILVVRDGITHRVPVRLQVNDGRMAKVALVDGNSSGVHELTGAEEVVVGRQMEIGDGAKVRTAPSDW